MQTSTRVVLVLTGALAVGCSSPPAERARDVAERSTASAPIAIRGDDELARAAASGAGTHADPYVIEPGAIEGGFSVASGATLDACIAVADTTRPFVIAGGSCAFAHVGARLVNAHGATVRGLAIERVVGLFGSASSSGDGADGEGIRIEGSTDVVLDGVTIDDVYGGFGIFGVPSDGARDGRAGGAAIGVHVFGSSGVRITGGHVARMWGGAGGAGAVGIFAGDAADAGGRGGLGGRAVGIAIDGGGDVTVSGVDVSGVRAGAGAAAAVSNLFFAGGEGGDAGDGNAAMGIAIEGAHDVAIEDDRIGDLWGSAGGAGAIGGVGIVGGKGGSGGRGGDAIAIAAHASLRVTIAREAIDGAHGAAGGAGAAGVIGVIGGAGGRGGDGGWSVGIAIDDVDGATIQDDDVRSITGGAGAAGGAGALGAGMIEAMGGDGGAGGWAIGVALVASSHIDEARDTVGGATAALGGIGGGVEWIALGTSGANGEAHDVWTSR